MVTYSGSFPGKNLETERNKLKSSVDSVARLLYYAQSNAYASKVQVAKLQKDLKALQDKLATTEKQYKETVERLQEQLDYYKTENDKLTETMNDKPNNTVMKGEEFFIFSVLDSDQKINH